MKNKKTKKKLRNIKNAFLDIAGCGHCSTTWAAETILGLPVSPYGYISGLNNDFDLLCAKLVKRAYKLGRKDHERELQMAMHHFVETPTRELKRPMYHFVETTPRELKAEE